MTDSKMNNQGKYLKEEPERKRKRWKSRKIVVFSVIAVVLVVAATLWIWSPWERSIYQTIVHGGYSGTQEQWLASLVGETVDGEMETAYTLAVANGYKGSQKQWNRTLTGVDDPSPHTSTYALACENGFDKTLVEWLTEIADTPETLGLSKGEDRKTEYELACEYGYSGSFIEWLVSVTYDRIYE